MTAFSKGLILCAAQVALVASLGAKLMLDRATLPRVWAKAVPFVPNLPVRGRYVRLKILTTPSGFTDGTLYSTAALSVADGQLVSRPDEGSNVHVSISDGSIAEPVAFFISEHEPDPSRHQPGEELWVEVTVPKKGPPRPIRLELRSR